jgi:hypothetical protein
VPFVAWLAFATLLAERDLGEERRAGAIARVTGLTCGMTEPARSAGARSR